jgi:hypothetical protein
MSKSRLREPLQAHAKHRQHRRRHPVRDLLVANNTVVSIMVLSRNFLRRTVPVGDIKGKFIQIYSVAIKICPLERQFHKDFKNDPKKKVPYNIKRV